MTIHRLPIGGVTLEVLDEGEGRNGQCPVLLVHGFPDDRTVWRKQVPALVAAGYRVIAPDMRGCGQSDMAPKVEGYRLDRLVADLADMLDALGIAQVRLVGHDWGAVIAWSFAIAHPDRVERLVAMSVGHPASYARGSWRQKLKGWYVLFFQWRGVAEAVLQRRDWRIFRRMLLKEDAPHIIANLSRPGRLTAGINYYRANIGMIRPGAPQMVRAKVLGLFSDGDRFLEESQMRNSARYVEGSFRCEVVRGAGHWLQVEAPERVNELLLQFQEEAE